MVVVPGGGFTIGSPDSEPKRKKNEGPRREVMITMFAVSEAETTRAQYAVFVEDTHRETPPGCLGDDAEILGKYKMDLRTSWRDPGFPQSSDHPVVCVNWQDARDYAAWLSRRAGQDYHLPSDSEWEYAARAGTTSAYFWGDDRELGCAYANGCDQSMKRAFPPNFPAIYAACDDGAVFTTPVRHYKPNGFGLFDMVGNAWEWVEDCNEPNYESLPTTGLPRTAEDCSQRDVRGGSWDDDPEDLRSASRHHTAAGNRQLDLGFRVARRIPRP